MELFPGKTSTIILENDIRPNLTVVKRDADTGAPVAGAVFTVKAADGHSVDEIKTGADGTATLENLLPGVYEVTEKSVPAPYLLDAPSQLVTLYPNRNHTVYFENHKKPILTIQKVDSITGNPIKGAKFQIWYASNSTDTGELNDLGTYFTDASGQIVLEGLRDGWYRVTELEPAPGFTIKEPATQEVYIEGGGNKSLTFENVPLNAIVVHKTDSVTGESPSGPPSSPLPEAPPVPRHHDRTEGDRLQRMAISTGLKPDRTSWRRWIRRTGTASSSPPRPSTWQTTGSRASSPSALKTCRTEPLIRKVYATNPSETLPDAEFKVTYADGTLIGDSNGIYRTDENGEILISGSSPERGW